MAPVSPGAPHLERHRSAARYASGSATPVELKYRSPDADTKRIMKAIVDLLPPEAREAHEPTDEEMRRTLPAGYKSDPDQEADRRPGTD